MIVAALKERIAVEATANLMPVLLERAALHHRKGWRDCDCHWCKIKQRATLDIATCPEGNRVIREIRREGMRIRYRRELAQAFSE